MPLRSRAISTCVTLLRDQPGVECVALKALGPAGAGGPTYQRDDFDVELLAGSERSTFLSWLKSRAQLVARYDIAPAERRGRTRYRLRRPQRSCHHVNQSQIEALGEFPGTVEPHPRLPR